jgi:hypothetical protein
MFNDASLPPGLNTTMPLKPMIKIIEQILQNHTLSRIALYSLLSLPVGTESDLRCVPSRR